MDWLMGAVGFQCCQNQPGNVSQNWAIYPWPLTSPMVTRLPRGIGMVLLLRLRLKVVSWRVVSLRSVASRKASAVGAGETALPVVWPSV